MTTQPKALAPVYTVEDVARALSVSKRTVFEWLRTGRLNGTNISPSTQRKRWRVSQQDVDEFLARGQGS